jgi:hypothetical protein
LRGPRAASAAFALALALAASRAAAADAALAPSPVLALRLGVAAALGSSVADVPMSDTLPFQFPIQVDALLREGQLGFGVYGSWGPARVGKCGDASCSAWVARLGLQATWTFTVEGRGIPWAGLASGYEWVREHRTRVGTVTTTWQGWEPLAVQGGIDWPVLRWLALGPYGLVGVGRYARYTVDTGVEEADAAIPHQAVHAWVHLGVRGRFILGEGK